MVKKVCFLEDFPYIKGLVGKRFPIIEFETGVVNKSEIIFVKLKNKIDFDLLKNFPNLEYIVCPTTGLTHIDLVEVNRRKISLISLQGETKFLENIPSTAEYTLLCILMLAKNISDGLAVTSSGNWQRPATPSRNLKSLSILLVGYGRVGRQVRNLLQGFECKIFAIDPYVEILDRDVQQLSLSDLSGVKIDIVSLHASYNSSRNGIFNYNFFARINEGFDFINTSRGELVDHDDLLRCLNSNIIRRAFLDVLPGEPDVSQSLLSQLKSFPDRIFLSPHIAGYTSDSLNEVENFVFTNLLIELEK